MDSGEFSRTRSIRLWSSTRSQLRRWAFFLRSRERCGGNEFDYVGKSNTQALKELKEAAYDLGCNAVIGVDFDYITLEPETVNAGGGTLYLPYVFCVTANGNAAIIEKE